MICTQTARPAFLLQNNDILMGILQDSHKDVIIIELGILFVQPTKVRKWGLPKLVGLNMTPKNNLRSGHRN